MGNAYVEHRRVCVLQFVSCPCYGSVTRMWSVLSEGVGASIDAGKMDGLGL